MQKKNEYIIADNSTPNIVEEPQAEFMKTFSSQEEGETYKLKKNLARNDMERFQMLCRLMRINHMLTHAKTT